MSYIGNAPITSAFVTDQFSGNGSAVTFTMSVAPANTSSLIVAVTGVLQDPSTYAVNGTTLTFSAAPPTGTGNISVRYLGIPASGVATTAYRTVTEFTATAGQTTFNVPSYTVGYIDVYRNGVRLGVADFTATTGTTVVLASAASLGDLVTTESFYVASVLNAIQATAGAVGTTYLADASVTQAKLNGGVAGTGPAFSAYPSVTTSLTSGSNTKITFDSKIYDTANCFSSSRFTPNVAGYYQINASNYLNGSTGIGETLLSKNGNIVYGGVLAPAIATIGSISTVNVVVYMNGSTDYLECYAVQTSGSTQTNNTSGAYSFFQGYLVRAI